MIAFTTRRRVSIRILAFVLGLAVAGAAQIGPHARGSGDRSDRQVTVALSLEIAHPYTAPR